MIEALLYGVGASIGLLLGALVAARWRVPTHVVAAVLAFGTGALIAAFAFELVQKPFESSGAVITGLGLLAGATVFIVLDTCLEKLTSETGGLGLLAGVTLDGVPENLALGASLVGGNGLVLLAAVFASNFPEAMTGAADMRDDGRSRRRVVAMWAAATVLLTLAVVAGRSLATTLDSDMLSALRAFAGGAVLASVADTAMPEAYERGGPWIAWSTVLGFFAAFMLSKA